ncbi:MAG: RNA polymerase sigma factor, partial [Planctomycetota bacterium]
MNDRSDENLVVACRAGDRNAYELLIRRHYKRAFLICLGILGNVHDAEDIAQDAMLKGYEQIRTLRDGSKFGLWIARIAKSLCINLIRRKKYAKKVVAERMIPVNQ